MDEMIRKLIDERARTWEQMKPLVDRQHEEERGLEAADLETFERMNAHIKELDARIEELHQLNVSNKRADEQRAAYESIVAPEVRTVQMDAETKALMDLIEGKRSHVDLDLRQAKVIPGDAGRKLEVRDLSKGTTTAGGNTVPTSFVSTLTEHMVELAAIRQTNARVFTTPGGENLEFPTTTSYGTAAIVGEGTAIAEADPAFGKVTLGAWKYAQLLQVSSELLQDTGVDLLPFLARDLGRALGQASGAAFITGTGTNAPYGVSVAVPAISGTAVTGTVAGGIEADDLISLQYAVIEPYARSGYWLMERATEGKVRKLKDADNQYLWQPGLQAGQPNLLLGRPIVSDPNMPTVAAASTVCSVLFGDFSAYVIRDVAGVRIERSDDYSFNTDQVTWRAILRTDGDLVDRQGAIKAYVTI